MVAAVVVNGLACYHPQTLDPRAVLEDLRRSDGSPPPAELASPPSSRAPGPGLDRAEGGSSSQRGGPVLGPSLSEERSVALALLWNRDLRTFRLTRGIAAGQVITAGALANPEIRAELTHIQELDSSKLGWDIRLTWEPPRPGVRAGRRAAANAHLDEVEQQVSEREWMLACDVRLAYATLQAHDEEIRVAQDTVANRRRLADAVGRRVAQGGTTRFDLDLVRLSLASAEHADSERRLGRTLAAHSLLRLLGVGAPGGDITVTGSLNEPPEHPQPSQQELEDRALANRPALAATRARHRASEETLRAETAARWPWIRFSAAPRIRRNEFFGATTDLVLGLDLILPILDTNRGHVESATSARDVARADITATIEGLRVDIGRSLATITAEAAMLRQLQAEIAPLLAEHDRVLEAALRAMELDLPSLIASENLVLASRIELVNARLELRKAWLALERTVGTRLLPPAQKSQQP